MPVLEGYSMVWSEETLKTYLEDFRGPSPEGVFLTSKLITLTHRVDPFTTKIADQLIHRASVCTEVGVST